MEAEKEQSNTSVEVSHLENLSELLSCLPLDSVDYAFAYGSGAIPQKGMRMSTNVADFIISVKNAETFHRSNMIKNPRHYSLIKLLGPIASANLQRNYAAKVFCNTMVKANKMGQMMKYSLIETNHLLSDLLDWEYLYVSGRLHKPTLTIVDRADAELLSALDVNLKSAVHAALLLLPENFSLNEFYTKVASLSYSGDMRVGIAEDRNKILNIVGGSRERFDEMYVRRLAESERVVVLGERVEQDCSTPAIYHHLNLLPTAVLWRLQDSLNRQQKWNRDLEEVVFALAHRRDCGAKVDSAIRSIVSYSSWTQSLKNIFTAGIRKSALYGLRKVLKMVRSR